MNIVLKLLWQSLCDLEILLVGCWHTRSAIVREDRISTNSLCLGAPIEVYNVTCSMLHHDRSPRGPNGSARVFHRLRRCWYNVASGWGVLAIMEGRLKHCSRLCAHETDFPMQTHGTIPQCLDGYAGSRGMYLEAMSRSLCAPSTCLEVGV
jgi:hypothetical protein